MQGKGYKSMHWDSVDIQEIFIWDIHTFLWNNNFVRIFNTIVELNIE